MRRQNPNLTHNCILIALPHPAIKHQHPRELVSERQWETEAVSKRQLEAVGETGVNKPISSQAEPPTAAPERAGDGDGLSDEGSDRAGRVSVQ